MTTDAHLLYGFFGLMLLNLFASFVYLMGFKEVLRALKRPFRFSPRKQR